jgi:hypothetical protein
MRRGRPQRVEPSSGIVGEGDSAMAAIGKGPSPGESLVMAGWRQMTPILRNGAFVPLLSVNLPDC